MSESVIYTFAELNLETIGDMFRLEKKVGRKFNAEEKATAMDNIEIFNSDADNTPGAQKGFVVYERKRPVAYLGISRPVAGNNFIYQTLGGFATDPEQRNVTLLNTMATRVLETQNPDYTYVYLANAVAKTTFRGLRRPGVHKWLQHYGYTVGFRDRKPDEVAERVGSAAIVLYPSRLMR